MENECYDEPEEFHKEDKQKIGHKEGLNLINRFLGYADQNQIFNPDLKGVLMQLRGIVENKCINELKLIEITKFMTRLG